MKNSFRSSRSLSPKILLAACLLCITSCGGGVADNGEANQTPRAAQTPANASSGNDARTSLNARRIEPSHGRDLLADYRNERLDNKPPPLEEGLWRRIVQTAYGAQAAPRDYSINSSARGSFTRPGASETVYLIQRGGPVAADPNGAQDLALVVFDADGQPVANFPTADFNFITVTSDTDDDGTHELLVEGSFFNMGTLGSSARLIELKSKQLRVVKTFEGVYENPCEGDPDSHVTAAGITYIAGGNGHPPTFKVSHYHAPCPARGGKPSFEIFTPAPDPEVTR